jgi:CheY-like chemotaxis protein
MRDTVGRLGYDVKTADEYDGLNMVDSFDPEIVITNLNMNETSGDVLINVIKQKNPLIKCYLCSCSDIKQEKLRNRYIDGFFKTPISPGGLEQILTAKGEAAVGSGTEILQPEPEQDRVLNMENRPAGEEVGVRKFAFCPYCGQSMAGHEAAFAFCPYCGTKF